MVREINQLPFPKNIENFFQKTEKKTITSYALMATLFLVITLTFFLAQQKQNIKSKASYDPTTKAFTETFDGSPSTPMPFTQIGQNNWDVQIHTRGELFTLSEMNAMHGIDCGAPPALHHLTGTYEDSVFSCRNHLMTALNSGSYGVIYLTPNSMVDFSNGEATITFEMSTAKMSTRDWWDITVSPFMDAQALPLLSDLSQGVDLQKPNNNSLVITTDNGEGSPNLKVVSNGANTSYPNHFFDFRAGIIPETNEMVTRQTFKLTLSKTRVKFERLTSPTATALMIIDKTIPELSWSQGVVQFGHHSYSPEKDNAGLPATWHWDAVTINPAVPFTMIKADRRFVDRSNPSISFNAPAPANSYLRFSGYCSIKVDGEQAQKMTNDNHPEHMSSYMMPISQEKQNFTFAFGKDDWFEQDCIAKDFAIWSTTVNGTSQPIATQTTISATATPTTILVTPTSTPTIVPSKSPTPTIKVTTKPTATPTPKRFSRPTKTPPPLPTNTPIPLPTASTKPTLTGDINGDAIVNVQDLSYMLTRWKTNDTKADLNKDKTVNTLDLSILLNNWK